MNKERIFMEGVRRALGDEEFEFVTTGGGDALLRIVNADIASLWQGWVAEAERLCRGTGFTIRPSFVVAGAALGISVAAMIDVGIERDDYLKLCEAAYDITVENRQNMIGKAQ